MEVSPVIIGVISLIGFLVLLFLEVPLGIALVAVSFFGMWAIAGFTQALGLFQIIPFKIASNYIWSLIPLFIFMGLVAFQSGLGADLYYVVSKWLGRIPGGLAMTTVGASAAFGAVCGDITAASVTFASVALPEMRRYKYDDSLAVASIVAGGLLSFLIPPSLVFVIYGLMTGLSIGALFLSGFIPGTILTILYIIAIYIVVRMKPALAPAAASATWSERFRSLPKLWGTALLVFLVFGGIYSGFITPMEAGGLGAVAAVIVGLVKRQLKWRNFNAALTESVKITGFLFFLFIGTFMFAPFFAITTIPASAVEFMLAIHPIAALIAIIIFYFIGGLFIDSLVLLLISLPPMYPIVVACGWDPIWFGVIMVLMLDLGSITPPVGMMVYIIGGVVPDVPAWNIFKAITPFSIAILVLVFMLILFPQIATFLTNLMMPSL
jgi:C4-dicarboxylate transporter DctM subunit